jgi:filamentous hemagglutinin
VEGNTHLEGATLAAVDHEGNDTGNLSLTTDSLSVEHLTNSSTASQQNIGGNTSLSGNGSVGTTGIQMGTGSAADASVTLATLGNGDVTVITDAANDTDSTAELNRDTSTTDLDLYATETGTEVSATLDTRLVTEEGRDQIAEDILRSGLIIDTVDQIIRTDKLNLLGFASELDQSNTIYDTVKAEIANDPALAAALQDPDLTPEQIAKAI